MCTFWVQVTKLQEFSDTYIIFVLANNIYQSTLVPFWGFWTNNFFISNFDCPSPWIQLVRDNLAHNSYFYCSCGRTLSLNMIKSIWRSRLIACKARCWVCKRNPAFLLSVTSASLCNTFHAQIQLPKCYSTFALMHKSPHSPHLVSNFSLTHTHQTGVGRTPFETWPIFIFINIYIYKQKRSKAQVLFSLSSSLLSQWPQFTPGFSFEPQLFFTPEGALLQTDHFHSILCPIRRELAVLLSGGEQRKLDLRIVKVQHQWCWCNIQVCPRVAGLLELWGF